VDDEVRRVFDRIEEEVLSRSTPEEVTGVEAGYLVPRETRAGVRYVRSRKPRLTFPPPLGSLSIGCLIILTTATVAVLALLTNDGAPMADWQLVLGFLYPLQLALDLVAVARFTWPFVKWRLGDLELELSADRLRAGIRCGPLWLDSQSILVVHIKRLVVVRRAEAKGGPIWELVVEPDAGLPLTLLSADDPGNVVPLAQDLHARLARREELCHSWPALAEQDRPAEASLDRPPRRPLVPGGGWTWLAIHVIGSVGLYHVVSLPWFQVPGPIWHGFVRVWLVALQTMIFLMNIAFVKMSRATGAR
jgi:hypothetical protein